MSKRAASKILAGIRDALAFVRGDKTKAKVSVWTVDRDGRVRKPERLIVLRGKATQSPK